MCRNPFCESGESYSKGWCQRCYKLFMRNGLSNGSNDVPAYAPNRNVPVAKMIAAARAGTPLDVFLWDSKINEATVRKAEREFGIAYDEFKS